MASISIMFFGFLRISEFLALRVCDVRLAHDRVLVRIRFSKTDTTGRGEDIHIIRGDKSFDAHRWVSIYFKGIDVRARAEEPFMEASQTELRSLVKTTLKKFGIEAGKYSTHSFRRGGAHEASRRGVQDSVIKAHGRWRSNCFQIYTNVQTARAGEILTRKLNE